MNNTISQSEAVKRFKEGKMSYDNLLEYAKKESRKLKCPHCNQEVELAIIKSVPDKCVLSTK